jgi:hypothetical protein
MRFTTLGAAACLAAALTNSAWAQEFKPTQKHSDTALSFEGGTGLSNYTLSVAGPNGLSASVSSRTAVPSLDLGQFGKLEDGLYNYEITAMTGERVPVKTHLYDHTATNGAKALAKGHLDNGRDRPAADSMSRSISKSGVFHVKDGKIEKVDLAAREPEKIKRTPEKK